MAKDTTKAAKATPELPGVKRGRGRPTKGAEPMTAAERMRKMREARKVAGLCPCCGQPIPSAS